MKKILEIEKKPFLRGYYYTAAFMSIASCKTRFDKSDAVVSNLKWYNGRNYITDFKYDNKIKSESLYTMSSEAFPENIVKVQNTYDIFLGKYNDTFYESVFLYNYIRDCNSFSFKLETMKKVYNWSMAGIMLIDEKNNNFKAVFCPNNIIQISAKIGYNECFKEIVNNSNYMYLMTKVFNNEIYVYASTSGELGDYNEIYHYECGINLDSYRMGFFLWIGEDYFENWFFSNYFQIHCDKELNINGDLKLNYYTPMINWRYNLMNPWLENFIIPRDYIDKSNDIFDFIRRSINDEYYVSLHLNEKYMKEKKSYNHYDFEHENLIYGIDDYNQILYLMSFNKNQVFEPYIIKFEDFTKAYNKTIKNQSIELLKYKIPCNAYQYSCELLKTSIDEYISGTNSSYREEFVKNIAEREYGVKVYNALLNNLEKLRDIRIVYLLYEHKLMMKKRVYFLNEKKILLDNVFFDIKNDVDSLCLYAEKLIMYNLKYNISNNKKLLIKMEDTIRKISSIEIHLLMKIKLTLVQD